MAFYLAFCSPFPSLSTCHILQADDDSVVLNLSMMSWPVPVLAGRITLWFFPLTSHTFIGMHELLDLREWVVASEEMDGQTNRRMNR